MSNTSKKPDLNLPAIERLTASRPASPVWYQGRKISAEEAAKLQAKAPVTSNRPNLLDGLSDNDKIKTLTLARQGKLKVPVDEESFPTVNGGYVHGVGFVIYDEQI